MIFQDPLTSLDPLQTVESQLVETMQVHLDLPQAEAAKRAVQLLAQVGIDKPELRAKHPHQFSGGMRQRGDRAGAVLRAGSHHRRRADHRAGRVHPGADPGAAALCREEQVGMIIITHDMGVIADVTDRVAVLYRGKLVEEGATAKILGDPDHPYTRSLISAVPRPDIKLKRFPLVTYIEDVKTPAPLDIATHWLGQRRDFGGRGDARWSTRAWACASCSRTRS